MKLYVFLVFICWDLALANIDPSICTVPTGKSQLVRPEFPVAFSVRVECNLVQNNYTIELHEYYDANAQKIGLKWNGQGDDSYTIFDYAKSQVIITQSVKDDPVDDCNVKKFPNNGMMSLLLATPGKNRPELISVADLSPADNVPWKYIPSTIIHGEGAEGWESCIYSTDMDSTLKVTWYYSSDMWATASGRARVPIRFDVIGKGNMHHIYEFSDYEPIVPDALSFQVPPGTYCKGIDTQKNLPNTTTAFSVGVELVNRNIDNRVRINHYEYFDLNLQLYRLDYFVTDKDDKGFGKGPLTQIHDFITGTAYILYRNEDKCDIHSISELSTIFNSDALNNKLRNSREMFHLDKFNYIYEGQREVRGVLCDVWIANRTDFPIIGSSGSIYEWYFASDQAVSEIGNKNQYNYPVMMTLIHVASSTNIVYNYYNYDEDFQMYYTFDISICYGDDQRLDYSFEIEGSYDSIVNHAEEEFKSDIRLNLCGYAGVSPLRITNIQIDTGGDSVVVTFSLLDVSGRNSTGEISLGTAAQTIVDKILDGSLIINLGDGRNFAVKQNTFQPVVKIPQVAKPKGTYSPGSMAGIGIGMLLVGCLIGAIIGTYIVKRRTASKFTPVHFENAEN